MTVRDTKKKTDGRTPEERSPHGTRTNWSRPRTGLGRGYDPARQAEEMLRTFSDRWEW
jgi:hypothetical protein